MWQVMGSFTHQLTKLTAGPITHHRGTNAFGSGKGHSHSTGGVVDHHSHAESLVSRRTGARKMGESETSRNAIDHADKRARPLERRDFKTARPARVFIRLRNPCFFARRRLLGWNVRFTPLS